MNEDNLPMKNDGGSQQKLPGGEKESFDLDPEAVKNLGRISLILERMRLSDYVMYMTQPKNVLRTNFLAGLARGLGFGLGMTVLLGVVLYVLGRMVDLPLIGAYIAKIVAIVHQELRTMPPPPTHPVP